MYDINDIEISYSLIETVVLAQLYRRDPLLDLRAVVKGKLTNKELSALYKRILQSPEFGETKKDIIKLEELTLVDDSVDTIALMYNNMLKQAQFEKKFDVVIRILKEIQKLKAIENNETKFEIKISIQEPADD